MQHGLLTLCRVESSISLVLDRSINDGHGDGGADDEDDEEERRMRMRNGGADAEEAEEDEDRKMTRMSLMITTTARTKLQTCPPPPWLIWFCPLFKDFPSFNWKKVGWSYPVEAQILKTSQFLDASGGFLESVWGTNYRKPLYLVMKNMTSSHKTSVCRCVYI